MVITPGSAALELGVAFNFRVSFIFSLGGGQRRTPTIKKQLFVWFDNQRDKVPFVLCKMVSEQPPTFLLLSRHLLFDCGGRSSERSEEDASPSFLRRHGVVVVVLVSSRLFFVFFFGLPECRIPTSKLYTAVEKEPRNSNRSPPSISKRTEGYDPHVHAGAQIETRALHACVCTYRKGSSPEAAGIGVVFRFSSAAFHSFGKQTATIIEIIYDHDTPLCGRQQQQQQQRQRQH